VWRDGPAHPLFEAPVRAAPQRSYRRFEPYGVQDRSVPPSSVESTDSSAGQRICVETDGELPPLALDPELPVLDVLPAEVPLLTAAPIVPAVAAPTELLVVPLLLEIVPAPFEGVLANELALPPACVLFDGLEVVPAAPAPTPTFVVVPVTCATAGVAMNVDRTRAAVRKRMAINPCLYRCQGRASA
jgi:hypothetical protein